MSFSLENAHSNRKAEGNTAAKVWLWLAKAFLALALFSVVIVLNGAFFPFTEGKYYFFRLSVESALLCTTFSFCLAPKPAELINRVLQLGKRPLFVAVSAFTGCYLLSAWQAVDSGTAFWSTLERGDGAFQMLHYMTFYVLSQLVLENQEDWRPMFQAAVSAAVLVVIYGMASARGNAISQLFSNSRFEGSLGNSDYAGTYFYLRSFSCWRFTCCPRGKEMKSEATATFRRPSRLSLQELEPFRAGYWR
jgi:hypothetical protein